MKQSVLLWVFFCVLQEVSAQHHLTKIDSIRTGTQVEKLVRSFKGFYKDFELKTIQEAKGGKECCHICKKIADSLNIKKAFYKTDVDNNGFTDLLVMGKAWGFQIFVLLNYGNDSLVMNTLNHIADEDCGFPLILHDTIIRYFYLEKHYSKPETGNDLLYKDLVYKFGGFVEQNRKPSENTIEKIEYSTSPCLTACPYFSITLNKDRSAYLEAKLFNFNQQDAGVSTMEGNYTAVIDDTAFATICKLLNYIDFGALNNDYSIDREHSSDCALIITYNDGKLKTIHDYGLIGTYGLVRLYELIFDLRFNQQWKKQ